MEEQFETVSVRIPEAQYVKLDRYAKEDYCNISVLVRQAIGQLIDRREKQQD